MTATPLPLAPRSSSGLLRPVFSALQRRALATSIAFGSVFLIGLGGICWQIYRQIPSGTRQDLLSMAGVNTALAIAALWIAVALATTISAALIFVRQHVTGPAAELARTFIVAVDPRLACDVGCHDRQLYEDRSWIGRRSIDGESLRAGMRVQARLGPNIPCRQRPRSPEK